MEACHIDDEGFSGFSDFTGKTIGICLVLFPPLILNGIGHCFSSVCFYDTVDTWLAGEQGKGCSLAFQEGFLKTEIWG